MGERDPGNKPASNDRIPYVYINVKKKKGEKVLQGDRVEHPDYIRENNIKRPTSKNLSRVGGKVFNYFKKLWIT